jgi:guanylate kinase
MLFTQQVYHFLYFAAIKIYLLNFALLAFFYNMSGKIIIITAPSGAGKTSITRYLLSKCPQLAFSVSAATRPPRGTEKNGVDYYFLSEEEFQEKIEANAFVEWEMVYEGKYYGTLRSELEKIWTEGKVPILDVDVKGAIHVQKQFPHTSLSIFVEPPSVEELMKRLKSRGTESEENIAARVSKAYYELTFSHSFNKVIVNHELEKACTETEEAIVSFLNTEVC